MRIAIVLLLSALCASLAQTAEDAWQNSCIAHAKLALSLTFQWNADEKPDEFKKNAVCCSLKFIRYSAVGGLVSKENLPPELFDSYEGFEFSNNTYETNQSLCKLLERAGPEAPTIMEGVRLLSSQDEAILKKAFVCLKDAPAELIKKFKELKNVDYKRAFAEQMKLLEWAEEQRVKSFEIHKINKDDLEHYAHWGRILAHPSYDETNLAQSIEVLYGVLLLRGDSVEKGLALADLTFHFDLDELRNEPQLKILKEMKALKGEFWSVRSNQFWQALNPWLNNNHAYFYFHPAEKHFRIDYAARDNGVSSKEYRSAHNWGLNEGPNKINPAKLLKDVDE